MTSAPNHRLVAARSAAQLTQGALAELANAQVDKDTGRPGAMVAEYVSKLERGIHRWPREDYRRAFRAVLGARTDRDLGFYPTRTKTASVIGDPPQATGRSDDVLDSRHPSGAHFLAPSSVLASTRGLAHHLRRGLPLRSEARGLPTRQEVKMAAEESARFYLWSASTNVDDDVIGLMTDAIAEIARRCLVDPLTEVFDDLLTARRALFGLIEGHQAPRHTVDLYKLLAHVHALLAHASSDFGHPHAAETHAQTALHCVEQSGFTPLTAYIRWVQSNTALWQGDFAAADARVEQGLRHTTGTGLLRLSSQRARIAAARGDAATVTKALTMAAAAPTESGADEPGVIGFAPGKAAYYASEAFRELGGHRLPEAVRAAEDAVALFAAGSEPAPILVVTAHFDLAHAHLAGGDLAAVTETLYPVLGTTGPENRTLPGISRANSMRDLIAASPEGGSAAAAELDNALAVFSATPATSRELDQGIID